MNPDITKRKKKRNHYDNN